MNCHFIHRTRVKLKVFHCDFLLDMNLYNKTSKITWLNNRINKKYLSISVSCCFTLKLMIKLPIYYLFRVVYFRSCLNFLRRIKHLRSILTKEHSRARKIESVAQAPQKFHFLSVFPFYSIRLMGFVYLSRDGLIDARQW